MPFASCATIGGILQFWISLQQLLILAMASEFILTTYLGRPITFGFYDLHLLLPLILIASLITLIGELFGFYGSAGAWCYTATGSFYNQAASGWLHFAIPLCTMLSVTISYCWTARISHSYSRQRLAQHNDPSHLFTAANTEQQHRPSSTRSSISSANGVESIHCYLSAQTIEQRTASSMATPWYIQLKLATEQLINCPRTTLKPQPRSQRLKRTISVSPTPPPSPLPPSPSLSSSSSEQLHFKQSKAMEEALEPPLRPLTAFRHKRFSFASSISQSPSITQSEQPVTPPTTSPAQPKRLSALVREWTMLSIPTASPSSPPIGITATPTAAEPTSEVKDGTLVNATTISILSSCPSNESMEILEEIILDPDPELPQTPTAPMPTAAPFDTDKTHVHSLSINTLPGKHSMPPSPTKLTRTTRMHPNTLTTTVLENWTPPLINKFYTWAFIIPWTPMLIYIAYLVFQHDHLTAQICALVLFNISGLLHSIMYGWCERHCRMKINTPLYSPPHMLWRHDTDSNRIVPGWKDGAVTTTATTTTSASIRNTGIHGN
ncbi:hypothetical protein BDF19DRAFT_430323 [Syncephalis fuscata]|nr:hypothetical protein BDF19DRAFT_430323 [Syncephalis fuscata]